MATPRQVGAWVLAATLAAGGIGTGFFLARKHDGGAVVLVAQMRDHVRRNSGNAPLFSALVGGPRQSQIADPAGLKDSKGNAITCSRASTKYCRKSLTFDASNITPDPENFANWGGYQTTAASNQATAPDGTLSASTITFGVAVPAPSFASVRSQNPTLAAGTYTFSVWLKAGTVSQTYLSITAGGSGYNTVTAALTSNWQRFSVTATVGAGAYYTTIGCDSRDAAETSQSAGTIYAWGAKLERLNIADPGISSWYPSTGNATANQATAFDGTLTASKLQAQANNGFHGVYSSIPTDATLTSTISVYLKKGTVRYGNIWWANSGAGCIFDLQTGTVIFSAYGMTGTITDAGNGWWLCSMTGAGTITNDNPVVSCTDGSGGLTGAAQSWTSDGTSTIYVSGARLDLGTSRGGAYISPMLVQMPANVTSVEPEGLLVEGAATNLLQQSNALATSPWAVGGGGSNTATNAAAIAPDGTLTATRLQIAATGAAAYNQVYQPYTFSAGTYTFSVYLRSATGSPQTTYVYFQQGGAWTTCAVTNQWQRFYVTATLSAGAAYTLIGANTNGSPGTPTSSAVDVYAWGAQLETGTFASSPIATAGSTATRAGDVVSTPNPLAAAFPFYVGITAQPEGAWNGASRVLFGLGNDSGFNTARFVDGFWADYDSAGAYASLQAASAYGAFGTAPHRIVAGKSAQTAYSLLFDGASVGSPSGTGTGMISQPSLLYLGGANFTWFNGWLSNIKVATTLSGAQ